MKRLALAGIDSAAAKRPGNSRYKPIRAYLRDGRFDQDRMLDVFEQLAAAKSDFRLSRIVCQMDWAADRSHIDDLIEFESRVNQRMVSSRGRGDWRLRLAKFGGGAVIDIMRTHPMIVHRRDPPAEPVLCAPRGIPARTALPKDRLVTWTRGSSHTRRNQSAFSAASMI